MRKRTRKLSIAIAGEVEICVVPEWFYDIMDYVERGLVNHAFSKFSTLPASVEPFSEKYDDWFVIRLYHAALASRNIFALSDEDKLSVIDNLVPLTLWVDTTPEHRWVCPTARLLLANFMKLVSKDSDINIAKVARPKRAEPILRIAEI